MSVPANACRSPITQELSRRCSEAPADLRFPASRRRRGLDCGRAAPSGHGPAVNSGVGGCSSRGTFSALQREGSRYAIRAQTSPVSGDALQTPSPAPRDGSEQLHVFLSVQIEDESLESIRQPVRVVWRGCLLAFSFSVLLFFFFFSSFLRAEGKWKNQGCVQAAAVNREPKGVLVGLNLAQWGSSRLALLLPGVRIRPTEARALLRGARLARRYAEGHEVDVRMSRRARSTPV